MTVGSSSLINTGFELFHATDSKWLPSFVCSYVDVMSTFGADNIRDCFLPAIHHIGVSVGRYGAFWEYQTSPYDFHMFFNFLYAVHAL